MLKWNQQNLFIGQPVYGNSVNALLWNIALGQGFTDLSTFMIHGRTNSANPEKMRITVQIRLHRTAANTSCFADARIVVVF